MHPTRLWPCIAALALGPEHVAAQAIAIRDVTVVDVVGGELRPHVTVLVEGDRITAVTTEPVELSADARVVDGTDRYLIPGLWDMHVHMTYLPAFTDLYVAHGVTGVRDMFAMVPLTPVGAQIAAGARVGPRIVSAGRIVDGTNPFWPGSVEARTPEEGRRAVARVQEQGSEFVKVYSKLDRETYLAIAEEAQSRGLPFAGHVPWGVRAAEASAVGQRSIEHLTGVLAGCSTAEEQLLVTGGERLGRRARMTLTLETYDEEKARALFATFAENGTWHCPTLTVLHAIAYLDDPTLAEDPRLVRMPPLVRQMWNPERDRRFNDYVANDWALAKEVYELSLQVVGELHRAGVPILAGTDAANPYCFPGSGLHEELERLVEAGLSPLEALRSATLSVARFLDREETLGSVAAGKVADLVLLERNPLEDITHTRTIVAVVAAGRLLERAELDALVEGK